MEKIVKSESDMIEFGAMIGRLLSGGEVVELIGDVGAGKTTFTKGLAKGLRIDEDIQSPTFTISRVYNARDRLHLSHYDFYRLSDAGIMAHELSETTQDPQTITVIEWADAVKQVLPDERLTIHFVSPSISDRHVELVAHGKRYKNLVGKMA